MSQCQPAPVFHTTYNYVIIDKKMNTKYINDLVLNCVERSKYGIDVVLLFKRKDLK
jgi:hypothetical protein